jgi:CheY-like chemotaxis protein
VSNQELTLIEHSSDAKNSGLPGQMDQHSSKFRHDLRNRLQLVSGYASLLAAERDGPLNAKQKQFVEFIRAGAQGVLEMIDQSRDADAKVAAGVALPETAQPQAEPRSAAAEMRTVLCIEDNASNLKLMESILAYRKNVRLVGAMQGQMGLELARDRRPDLILSDLHLPDMPGEEVLRRLKEDPRTSTIPVTVVSAETNRGEIERMLQAGAHSYLTKPLDVRAVLRLLDDTLHGCRASEMLAEPRE